jgi:hypothetical protein
MFHYPLGLVHLVMIVEFLNQLSLSVFFGFELGAENRFSYIVYNVVLGSCILCA